MEISLDCLKEKQQRLYTNEDFLKDDYPMKEFVERLLKDGKRICCDKCKEGTTIKV